MTTQPISPPAGRSRSIPRFLPAVLSLVILFVVLMASGNISAFAYHGARKLSRWQLEQQLIDWSSQESDHFVLKYQPEDENTVNLVLEAAERAYSVVTEDMDFVPPNKTLVAVYPSAQQLNADFGWSPQESALGVYWGGTIRVLSPNVWIEETDEDLIREIFWSVGPMAHEFTHLVLDYKTAGNYPRWFSEGLAQYMELQHGGVKLSPNLSLVSAQLYSIDELEEFNKLDDELLAYEQSLSLIQYLVHIGGPEIISEIVDNLAEGYTFTQSLNIVGIPSLNVLEKDWLEWIK